MRHAAETSPPLPDESAPTRASAQEIEYAPAVMEAIRSDSVTGLLKLRGGIEVGGVLFGRNTSESIRILAARPLDCEHRFGPSFVLSEKDEERLRQLLDPEQRDDEIRGLEPVGWYVSHCRRSFALEESDIRIFDRYFQKVGSVTLIVMPEKIKATRACFFIRDPNSTVRPDVPSCEVLLPSPLDLALSGAAAGAPLGMPPAPRGAMPPAPSFGIAPAPPIGMPPAPDMPAAMEMELAPVSETGAVAPIPAPGALAPISPPDARDVASRRLQTFLAQQEKHRRVSTWNLWATMTVLLVCMAGAGYLWWRANAPEGPPAIPLHVSDSGAQIRIEWDAKLPSVESAQSGVLEMRESDGAAEEIKLPPDALRIGSAYYTRRTDKVEIRLKLVYADRAPFESVVYFIHPVTAPAVGNGAPPPTALAQQPAPNGQTQQTLPTARTQQPPPNAQAQLPAASLPVSGVKEGAKDFSKDVKTAESRNPATPRVFRPPTLTRPQAAAPVNVSSATLPTPVTAPPIQPPAVNLPIPAAPAIAPPPAPAPAAAPAKSETTARQEPPRPRSGRLIWTGELGRNGLLSLSPQGASPGWVNGRLPGFPVRVSVHVAQLVEGGMEVYTDDAKKAAEAPSAQNGWNIVVYKPDTKKIAADVRIVEAPGATNSWNHMVVQNGKHAVSVLVIDWVAQ